jgi:hypothetical protein
MFYMSVALSQIVQEAEELLRESRNFPHFVDPEVLLSVELVSTHSHANPVHCLAPYIFKVHFIIILPYSLLSSTWSLLFRFSYQNVKHFSYLSCMLRALGLNIISFRIHSSYYNYEHVI